MIRSGLGKGGQDEIVWTEGYCQYRLVEAGLSKPWNDFGILETYLASLWKEGYFQAPLHLVVSRNFGWVVITQQSTNISDKSVAC
jgi:hypothetical protein